MADHRLYQDFVDRLGEAVPTGKETLVNSLLKEAEDFTKDRIGRDAVPERLNSAVVKLAVGAYNKCGAEGESSRSEGGISRVFDDMPDIQQRYSNYPRKVGVVHARGDHANNGG